MGEYRMPSLGADMQRGVLGHWLVKPGDRVSRGDIIAVIGTDKADIEAEVFEDGVVERLLAKPGDELPVGAVLATIRGDAGPPAPNEPSAPAPPPAPASVRASPLARRLAAEWHVDLASIAGTGPGGVIERHDVEAAAKHVPPPEPARPGASEPSVALSGMRRAIAVAMARSNWEIPHYYLETSIDMRTALAWLEQANAVRPLKDRLLPAAILLKAVVRALAIVPELNGHWVDGQPRSSAAIHLGVAVALRQGGLIIPCIRDAGPRSVDDMMQGLRGCVERARSGRLRTSDLSDATITVTNLGDLGVEVVHGVIYPPQVALVGFGRIRERPWAEDGMLGVRPVLEATLAGDHRASDGRDGARFLDALDKLLQKPDTL
ncbi:MAG: dihydrolipoamide acetyltransferase family protein [Bryobacteraceae bacterium]